jgi:hypothetical protein
MKFYDYTKNKISTSKNTENYNRCKMYLEINIIEVTKLSLKIFKNSKNHVTCKYQIWIPD